MNGFMTTLKKFSWKFYAACVITLFALIVSVLYAALDYGDSTFSWLAFFMPILGGAAAIVATLVHIEELLFAASVLTALGLGEMIRVGLPSVSDLWNGVVFVGGNSKLALVFLILFVITAVLMIILNFFSVAKKQN